MASCTRMFTRVTIRRAVATKCHAALLARAQVKPLRADLDAFGALGVINLFDRRDRVEMRATPVGHN
jgi:hypothetical protein